MFTHLSQGLSSPFHSSTAFTLSLACSGSLLSELTVGKKRHAFCTADTVFVQAFVQAFVQDFTRDFTW